MDQLFDSIYAPTGRSSIPPEKLLKAQLLAPGYQMARVRVGVKTRPAPEEGFIVVLELRRNLV